MSPRHSFLLLTSCFQGKPFIKFITLIVLPAHDDSNLTLSLLEGLPVSRLYTVAVLQQRQEFPSFSSLGSFLSGGERALRWYICIGSATNCMNLWSISFIHCSAPVINLVPDNLVSVYISRVTLSTRLLLACFIIGCFLHNTYDVFWVNRTWVCWCCILLIHLLCQTLTIAIYLICSIS